MPDNPPKKKTSKTGIGCATILVGIIWLGVSGAFPVWGLVVNPLIAIGVVTYMVVKLRAARGMLVGLTAFALLGIGWAFASLAAQQEAEEERLAQEQTNNKWNALLATAEERATAGDHGGAVDVLLEARELTSATRSRDTWLGALRDSAVLGDHDEGIKVAIDGMLADLKQDELTTLVKKGVLSDRLQSTNTQVVASFKKLIAKPARDRLATIEKEEKEAARKRKEEARLEAKRAKEEAKRAREEAERNRVKEPCRQIVYLFGASSPWSDLQMEEQWKYYKGKTFKWRLEVVEVTSRAFSEGFLVLYKCRRSQAFSSDIRVRYDKNAKAFVMGLKKRYSYEIQGTLRGYGTILGLSADHL